MAEIAGLNLIIPSSVSGATVSATGKVSFSAVSSFSVNGCFTASYDNYLLVCQHIGTSSGVGFRLRFRAAGSDDASSNYHNQFVIADGSSVTGTRLSSQTQGFFTEVNTQYSGVHTYFYGPALAQSTALRSVTADVRSNASIIERAITHSVASAFDGLTLYPSSGTVTGSLTIYGLSQ